MNELLRVEYEKYLAEHGLKPRELPPAEEREAGLREIFRIKYEAAKEQGDPTAEDLRDYYNANFERILNETQHPAVALIEKAAADVEATIRSLPAFAERFHDDVFVGEFPTGSFACQTVKVDGGFLVLVNSGMMVILQQVVAFLTRGDPDNPDSEKTREAADGVAAVLASYVELGDPFYGPLPVNGGLDGLRDSLLSGAAERFVIAHEYAHILALHFSDSDHDRTDIETSAGVISVLKKSHEQEFEADDLGYKLILGVEEYDRFDFTVIDAGLKSDDWDAWLEGVRQKSVIAGPFIFLILDLLLENLQEPAFMLDSDSKWSGSHPPSLARIGKLLEAFPDATPMQKGFINFPFMLFPWVDYVGEQIELYTTHKLRWEAADTPAKPR
ncbi:Mycobacterium numidiamassiliense ORFan [Mycobacterium numidiamassiliense]|uniref:Mycobacterium numidiamassiliense ORFan n=1 Tax=Mycobacterium numidiamassiliense TaxID=1841861 RepID=A0A2U3PDU2_9MYCO|nr:hypothetical protein [Mycobacterium numidiamassiliense]SPM41938.1 Mycobacterium numidiamassiliense ORFan [Mycobacterium numidiamassiliense]